MSEIYTDLKYVKQELPDGSVNDKAGMRYTKKNNANEDVAIFVPMSEGNRHYDDIMKRVEEGTLTIEAAD
tara:strand:- start:634 stop:843 length:210 start_codon:yes stop_codon:yes gene_type:complete